jgi:hypothetical protein
MSKCAFVAIILIAVATPALAAEYYIGQNPSTKQCKVLTERPDGQTMVMMGTETYASKEEAKAARKNFPDCKKKSAD